MPLRQQSRENKLHSLALSLYYFGYLAGQLLHELLIFVCVSHL